MYARRDHYKKACYELMKKHMKKNKQLGEEGRKRNEKLNRLYSAGQYDVSMNIVCGYDMDEKLNEE